MGKKNVVAIGNSVVDCLHDPALIEKIERESNQKISAGLFLSSLPKLLPEGMLEKAPRAGDSVLITREVLEEAAKKFLAQSGVASLTESFNKISAVENILGRYTLVAGGSIANTASALAHSKTSDGTLVNMKYVTVRDEGKAGDVFTESMPKNVVTGPRYGGCLHVHVVPFQGDRILVASPPANKPTDHYDLSKDLPVHISEDTDVVMIEGFLAFGKHFENIASTTLQAIRDANKKRLAGSRPPIHLVIATSAQLISSMETFRNFVLSAMQMTDVTIHGNTGEFRRLMDNDITWREEYDRKNGNPFHGLDGSDLESAKRIAPGYREAKTAVNIETIKKIAMPLAQRSSYDIRFVLTDGGNSAYVVVNDAYSTHAQDALDPSEIVNTVGAGDAFMAGFWVAQFSGLQIKDSMRAGNIFAKAVIIQQEARLSSDLSFKGPGLNLSGPLALLAQKGVLRPQPGTGRKLDI